mgnify:CR=1 FL=1
MVLVLLLLLLLLLLTPWLAAAQSIDVTPYVLPVDAANRGAEIAEIHPAFDLDPDAADFGGKQIPALWRSNGLVTGLMGILRFGPAIPAFLCWKEGERRACPPFHPLSGAARMTRMQSDAITLRYEPLPGIEVQQTMMAPSPRSFRSRALFRSSRPVKLEVELCGGIFEQSETGQVKWPEAPPANTRLEHKGVVYLYQLHAGVSGGQRGDRGPGQARTATFELDPGNLEEVEFVLGFGPNERAARDAVRFARAEFFDVQLAQRRKASEEFFARVPQFDFGDAHLNLFHRIQWERLRALAENPAGLIPYRYFMGTSAPWGIDGLWLWDSVLEALVLHYQDPGWAEDLIRAVLAQQREDGLVPHWTTPHSRTEIAQPPLLSWGALRLYTLHGRRGFLDEVYPRLARLHRWFQQARTATDGLPFWKQPDESGMDNSPAFDEGADAHVDLAAELLADAQALERIARLLGRRDEAGAWRKQAEQWRAQLEKMWDESAGFYFPLKSGQRVPVYAIQGFFPLWDAQLDPARRKRLLARLQDPAQFWPPFPIPSVSLRAPQFMTPRWFANTYGSPETGRRAAERLQDYSSVYWRGPVWVFSNAIVYEALRAAGEFAVADELGRRMVAMMMEAARYGGMLWENFDPRTGRPSRLLPRGQADEMAASIYFLKVLYDLRLAMEPAEAPERARLHLRFTHAPSASVQNLRFGDWSLAAGGKDGQVTLEVERAPAPDAVLEVENAAPVPLAVRFAGRTYPLAPGKKFTARP